MKITKPGEKLPQKELRRWAKIAGEAYMNDPVHSYATKNPRRRKQFVYHFQMERLNTSNGEDYIFTDDEGRGICVWRKARNEYTFWDFMKCPDWFYLYIHMVNTVRTLRAYSPLDVGVFGENVWIISPVFVAPAYQGQGVATALIKESMAYLSRFGYDFGLEAQDEKNVAFYEKLGFKTIQTARYEKGNITHRLMVYDKTGEKTNQ